VDFNRRGSRRLPDQEDLRLYFTGVPRGVKPSPESVAFLNA